MLWQLPEIARLGAIGRVTMAISRADFRCTPISVLALRVPSMSAFRKILIGPLAGWDAKVSANSLTSGTGHIGRRSWIIDGSSRDEASDSRSAE